MKNALCALAFRVMALFSGRSRKLPTAVAVHRIVEDSDDDSELINDPRRQEIVRAVIGAIEGSVRYSLNTAEEKRRIATFLSTEELLKARLRVPHSSVRKMVDALFDDCAH